MVHVGCPNRLPAWYIYSYPGIDPGILEEIFEQNAGGILGMFDMFAGGALGRMTIFALNIMPYISAAIIMQLMTAVSPNLENLKKEGEAGRKKLISTQDISLFFWPLCRRMGYRLA